VCFCVVSHHRGVEFISARSVSLHRSAGAVPIDAASLGAVANGDVKAERGRALLKDVGLPVDLHDLVPPPSLRRRMLTPCSGSSRTT
jgi:hypothetical protein